MATKGGLLSAIKSDVERTGSNRGKFFYVKSGAKARIRFIEDFEQGKKIPFHDRWDPQLKVPCKKARDEDADCQYCGAEGIRNRDMYCWAIWDYDANDVKLFMYPANNCSPVPTLAALFETYGTITDRDFTITRTGAGTNTAYTLIGLDKTKFRNEKAKPPSDKAFWKALFDAHPAPEGEADEEEDDEGEAPKNSKSKTKIKAEPAKTKKKAKPELEEDEDEDDDDVPWGDDEEDDELDYDSMSAKELYALCKDRKIKVEPRKSEATYIKKLKAWDAAHAKDEDDEDEEDDDFWGEE